MTMNRKTIMSYSLASGTKRALELSAIYFKCTKNQLLDCALYEFINNNVEGASEVNDILRDMPTPINITRK